MKQGGTKAKPRAGLESVLPPSSGSLESGDESAATHFVDRTLPEHQAKIAWLWLKNWTAQVDLTATSRQAHRLGIGNAYGLHYILVSRTRLLLRRNSDGPEDREESEPDWAQTSPVAPSAKLA